MRRKLCVCGDTSPDCASSVTTIVKTVSGLEEVHFNMGTGEVTYTPIADKEIDEEKVCKAVRDAGYTIETA